MRAMLMLRNWLLTSLCCGWLALQPACSPSSPPPRVQTQAIVDGQDDTGHPEVGLFLIGAAGGVAEDICSATVIGPRVLLTAAHCLHSDKTNLFQLNGKVRPVAQVIPHPDWDGSVSKYRHDIGVALLQDPVSVATPQVGPMAPQVGMAVTLVGFGRTGETIKDSGTKRVAQNSVAAVSSGYFTIVGTGGGVGNTCKGDSGGPVYTEVGGKEVLLGVISADQSPFCQGTKTFHVTVKDYLGWVQQQAALADDAGPPAADSAAPVADGGTSQPVDSGAMADGEPGGEGGLAGDVPLRRGEDGCSVGAARLPQAPWLLVLLLCGLALRGRIHH